MCVALSFRLNDFPDGRLAVFQRQQSALGVCGDYKTAQHQTDCETLSGVVCDSHFHCVFRFKDGTKTGLHSS
jgi:hypothetical protein